MEFAESIFQTIEQVHVTLKQSRPVRARGLKHRYGRTY
jgi:hypothetical protein